MDLFDEIDKVKEDFPRVNRVTNEVRNYKLNVYQIIAIVLFGLCFILGIIFGNLFATCETSSWFFYESCKVKEFNFSLMIMIWGAGFFVSLAIFSVGHIILLLTQILEKVSKFNA